MGHSAASVANLIGATLQGNADVAIEGVAAADIATEHELTFITSLSYAQKWLTTSGRVAIVGNDLPCGGLNFDSRTILFVENPDLAMAKVLELFELPKDEPPLGVHDSCVIDPTATIGKNVRIGPFVRIGAHAKISDGCVVHSNVDIGMHASVGTNTILYSGVTIGSFCAVGSNCIFHGNVVIGADGFGYRPAEDGSHLVKMIHIGNVEIHDHVEIGALSSVDRGKFAATTVGKGTKLDNHVQVGHNVRIGKNCVIAAYTGLAGSVQIGDWCQIGAGAGIIPHVKIGAGAMIGAKSGVMNDVPAGESWLGVPAGPTKNTLRQWSAIRKLPKIIKKLAPLDS
ncbi:MAG: UDP-3-O-(3-hydroxymyristoyl)glucosamine N-acyltransferase [Phycisphaerales bacterium]|jgi:UDP-3-O-[3-hydroxymyristoyl] glucosamine N-acyltransferase|nr:UDP-3-O-(3-hydroxymyristoyl)glucosamine N-acyltransferase [Phycisphaerales bacterium]